MKHIKTFESFLNITESSKKETLFSDMNIGDTFTMYGSTDSKNKPMILKKTDKGEAQIVNVGSVKGVKVGEYQYPSPNGMYSLTESTGTDKYHMTQKELEKFLKALPEDIKVQMPAPIRGGEVFNKSASQVLSTKEALNAVSHYKDKEGKLTAVITGVILKEYDRALENQMQVASQAYDEKKVLQHKDKVGKLYLSFEYENFDSDAHANAVRGMSLD